MASRKKIRQSASVYVFQVFNYCFLTALVMMCLYPMWYCLMASFSEPSKMMAHMGPLLTPLGFSVEAYKKVFLNPNIISGYKNTLIILVVGVSLNLVMTSLAAYVLSRKNVMWKKPLNLKSLHLNNTLWGLIIPWLINTFNMIIMRTAFESIPESLIEAAQIDGATHWKILRSIVLPLSKATLAVMVLYYGVEKWNGWFWASAIIRDRSKLPLQVILREILLSSTQSMQTGSGGSDTEAIGITIRYATTIVATVPILCVYPFVQKYFTKGVMIGAVKE